MFSNNHRTKITCFIMVMFFVFSCFSVFAQVGLVPPGVGGTYRPPITGKDGMVVSNNPMASMSGFEILEKGGNAVDAAVAVAASLSVAEPALSNIFGGDAFIMIYSSKTGKVTVFDASGWAPEKANIDFYIQQGGIPSHGMLSVEIPGAFSGWMQALKKYGTMKPKKVFQPAIRLCEEGIVITPWAHDMINYAYENMNEDAKAVFAPNGKPLAVGDICYQNNLAKTFKEMGKAGWRAEKKFYQGELAERIVEFSDQNGGILSFSDFADFRAVEVEPLHTTYSGKDVYACPPGCQGLAFIEALNILQNFDVASFQHNSAEYINLLTEAINLAIADRDKYVADPRFTDIPLDILTSKEYGKSRADLIQLGKTLAEATPAGDVDDTFKGNTTFFAVVDDEKNIVACTTSILHLFGSGMMAGDTGIILNNRMEYFWLDEEHVNALEPRKRTFQTITPSIAMENGKPYMAFGTPGGDVQEQTKLQILFNVLHYGMNPQRAIEVPRFMSYNFPSAAYPHKASPGLLRVENRISEEVVNSLSGMGYNVKPYTDWSISVGGAGMIIIDPETGFLMGGVDPRREGYVIGK